MSEPTTNGDLRGRIRSSVPKGESLEVEGWDATIELRPMSVAEKASLAVEDEDDLKADEAAMMLPRVIVFTAYDPESGDRLFTDEDLEWLKDQPSNVIETVALAGFRVSGVDGDEAKKVKKGST